MDFTSDKLRSLVRKWQTLIEAHIDVKTTDGYLVRLFTIGFTKKRPNQVKKTTYAQSAQIREIRQKMFEIAQREATSCDLKQLVQKLVPEVIGREIEKASQGIYPLQNCYVRKVRTTSLAFALPVSSVALTPAVVEPFTGQDPQAAEVRHFEAARAPLGIHRDGGWPEGPARVR